MTNDLLRLAIPPGIDFSDLRLSRTPDGAVTFDWQPIERVCLASGIDIEIFRDGPEDNVSGLIVAWYDEHRQRGGAPDRVADDLIAETVAEDAAGQPYSHEPGRA